MTVTVRAWLQGIRALGLASGLLCVGIYTQDDIPLLLWGLGASALVVLATTWRLRQPRPVIDRPADVRPTAPHSPEVGSGAAGRLDEWEILRAAEARRGRVTPIEIAADTESPLEQAQSGLDALQKQGACTLEVSESGQLVYCFPDFMWPEAKERLI